MKAHVGAASDDMISSWESVFSTSFPSEGYPSTLAFRYPFTAKVERFTLVFNLDGYYLTNDQYTALRDAIATRQEAGFFVSTYEDERDFLQSGVVRGDARHFVGRSDDSYEDYRKAVPWPLEYGMYSRVGEWGVIVSHESHALIGGSRDFIEAFKASYRCFREDISDFSAYWSGRSQARWAAELLLRLSM